MLSGLSRYIATVETAKHRFFVFLDASILPDNKLICIALEDAYSIGVLSSRLHVCWALAAGGLLEDRPVYSKTTCFDNFPFPIATDAQKVRIRELAEQLDAHRKRQQAEHSDLTMTGMYNVLEKLRNSEPLTAKDKTIHEQGLVSVLKQLHEELDAAVFDAYGWPTTLTDEQILERLVALNAERAAEEAKGLIRWLRPEFQNQGATASRLQDDAKARSQTQLDLPPDKKPEPRTLNPPSRSAWPKTLPDQVRILRDLLIASPSPVTAAELARTFTRVRPEKIEELLKTLVTLGQAREVGEGRYGG
jgi:hypothetical protein